MDMLRKKYYIFSAFGLVFQLGAMSLGDFAGYWEGLESLSSPSINYEDRELFISLRHNANSDENLLYNSNSYFIYNGYLDWADHYCTYNKSENQVTFGRRFTTPLGILGTNELVYDIIDDDGTRIYLEYVSDDGLTTHSLNISLSSLLGVADIIPETAILGTNYPNPFNPSTSIPIRLSKDEHTRISVFNSNGSLIKDIHNGHLESGYHIFKWNGTNNYNLNVSAGIYFYKLYQGNNFIATKKMILLK